ncbi:hypothetical protein TrCOL_g726 [Triparma columacea]|uniref:serine C-palmitoyltransferase n=1 Tax=Triparma columacea TaxID=722753 RepID=A0A9W7G698_9STRA|nr:hypothetical protein TrCOL_g726 [Triparma columacea]
MIIWAFLTQTKKRPGKFDAKLSDREKNALIADWTPVSLTPSLSASEERTVSSGKVLTGYTGRTMTTSDGIEAINCGNFDFLGMSIRGEVKEASREALEVYGCGSCGPRGFYGTIMPHVTLEERFAEFMGQGQQSIMYSDGASTSSSTVAAFAKRGDLLVVDEGCFEGLLTGALLSRSNVRHFKHNDMDDLRRVLEEIKAEDKKLGRDALEQRRFIVVEGIYRNYGTVLDLPRLVDLKGEFGFRLLVDESLSFGTLGDRGQGVTDLYGLPGSVEITTISLENALGSVGGVTVGDEEVTDHQRLSGAGYVFSASACPFVSEAAVAGLGIMEREGKSMMNTLKKNLKVMLKEVDGIKGLTRTSDDRSPVIFLVLKKEIECEEEKDILKAIEEACMEDGLAVVATGDHIGKHLLYKRVRAGIRITVNVVMTEKDVKGAGRILKEKVRMFV